MSLDQKDDSSCDDSERLSTVQESEDNQEYNEKEN